MNMLVRKGRQELTRSCWSFYSTEKYVTDVKVVKASVSTANTICHLPCLFKACSAFGLNEICEKATVEERKVCHQQLHSRQSKCKSILRKCWRYRIAFIFSQQIPQKSTFFWVQASSYPFKVLWFSRLTTKGARNLHPRPPILMRILKIREACWKIDSVCRLELNCQAKSAEIAAIYKVTKQRVMQVDKSLPRSSVYSPNKGEIRTTFTLARNEQDLYYHHLSPRQQSCKQQQQHQWQWEERRNHTNDSHQYQKLQVLTASTTRKQWKLLRKLRKQLWQTKLRQCKLVPSQGLESPWLLSHAHPRVV